MAERRNGGFPASCPLKGWNRVKVDAVGARRGPVLELTATRPAAGAARQPRPACGDYRPGGQSPPPCLRRQVPRFSGPPGSWAVGRTELRGLQCRLRAV